MNGSGEIRLRLQGCLIQAQFERKRLPLFSFALLGSLRRMPLHSFEQTPTDGSRALALREDRVFPWAIL
jgi:hypothetical protein